MNSFWTYIKTHKLLVGIVGVVIVGGVWYYLYHKAGAAVKTTYVTAAAQIQTLTNTVTATGQIAASNQVDIKPSSTAEVTSVKVKQGDQVQVGQVLLTLDETSASQQVAQAKAALQSAQASYANLEAGLTPTDQAIAQLSVTQAQQALANAQTNLATVTTEQAQDVATAQTNLMNAGLTATPSDTLSTGTVTLGGSYTGTAQGQFVVTIYNSGNGLTYSVSGLGNATGVITRGLQQPLGNGLNITFSQSGTFSTTTTYTINVPNTSASNYQSSLTAYTNAQTAQQTALQNAQQSITSAQNALQSAQLQYQDKVAPPTAAQAASAQAQVSQAQANYNNAVTAYQNNIITSPIAGTVAAVNVSVGDQANSGSGGATETDLVTIITPQQVADISLNEVDAAKVKTGQKATMTFDAVSGLSLTGTVAEIDTVGTVSQGVVTYNAQIALDTINDQIKPGMTADVTIIASVDPNVLTVPSTAIKTDSSGNSYVQVLDSSGQPQNVTVQIGDSNNTDTVITSGLTAGQEVVTQTITASAAKTAAAAATTSLLGGGAGGRGGFTGAGAGGAGAAARPATTTTNGAAR